MIADRAYEEGRAAYEADDFAAAAAKLLPLAEAGHAKAQQLVGQMYWFGRGVEASAERCVHFLKAAADQGDPVAAQWLFILLQRMGAAHPPHMDAVPPDPAAAEHDLRVAVARSRELAEAGDADAMTVLAYLLHHGCGVVEPDYDEAMRWFGRALRILGKPWGQLP